MYKLHKMRWLHFDPKNKSVLNLNSILYWLTQSIHPPHSLNDFSSIFYSAYIVLTLLAFKYQSQMLYARTKKKKRKCPKWIRAVRRNGTFSAFHTHTHTLTFRTSESKTGKKSQIMFMYRNPFIFYNHFTQLVYARFPFKQVFRSKKCKYKSRMGLDDLHNHGK